MNTFKIGDWVLDDEDNLFQVSRVRDNEIALVDEQYYVPAKEFRLWIPKVGDWVRWDRGKVSEVLAVSEECLIENHSALSNGCNIHNHELELWTPKENEWCWFNMEFLDGWQNPVLMRYGEQDMSRWNIEPFIGNLPNFIKREIR